jgi:hypothetical protein
MLEDAVDLLIKPISSITRFVGLIVFEGAIFRPMYWLGWFSLKLATFVALPKKGINQPDYEIKKIAYLTWVTGFALICIFGILAVS